MKNRKIFVWAEFEAGGYSEPKGYVEAMLDQAMHLIATQKRAAAGQYREQVWETVLSLVRAAKVGVWVPGTRKNVQRIIDRNRAEAERLKRAKAEETKGTQGTKGGR